MRYQERTLGFSEAAALPLAAFLSLGSALLVFAVADWYVVVTPHEVVRNGFFTIHEERREHADVVEVETAPYLQAPLGGSERRISVIHCADGDSWAIAQLPGPASNARILEITRYISERSLVPVTEVESLRTGAF